MVTTYRRSGPPAPLIIVAAIALVLSCVLIWAFGTQWLEKGMQANTVATQQAGAIETATSRFPTFDLGPSPTPLPACEWFSVTASSAFMRKCPDSTCEIRESRKFEAQVCVYGVASSTGENQLTPEEWYLVDLNPNGAFRDLVYMHQSVLKPLNPTPRPTRTFTALPTVTLTPLPPLPTVTPLRDLPIPLATLPAPNDSEATSPPRTEF